jgi:hypothetical protein
MSIEIFIFFYTEAKNTCLFNIQVKIQSIYFGGSTLLRAMSRIVMPPEKTSSTNKEEATQFQAISDGCSYLT